MVPFFQAKFSHGISNLQRLRLIISLRERPLIRRVQNGEGGVFVYEFLFENLSVLIKSFHSLRVSDWFWGCPAPCEGGEVHLDLTESHQEVGEVKIVKKKIHLIDGRSLFFTKLFECIKKCTIQNKSIPYRTWDQTSQGDLKTTSDRGIQGHCPRGGVISVLFL